jgi:hypothetical protein
MFGNMGKGTNYYVMAIFMNTFLHAIERSSWVFKGWSKVYELFNYLKGFFCSRSLYHYIELVVGPQLPQGKKLN